jgi:eukaryotic-like serine/threonine-protein kinase
MPPTKKLQIGAELGHGFFGRVCEGVDPIRGRVAVKILVKNSVESDAEWQARRETVVTEGSNLTKAEHQNIVRVFYAPEPGGDPMLVMEYCGGGSLQASYEAGPIPLPRVKRISSEVSLGLAALHARGMLHRDIKPSNVLLDASGHAKLGDFGLATDDLVLGYASHMGYTDHLAFEVYAGKGTSVRSDLWAVGMTLYRLIHGRVWYEQSAKPRHTVPDGKFASKLRWLPHVPHEWRRLIRKALHDDPQRRFQSADALLNALAGVPLPEWACTVTADRIAWSRRDGDREYEVTWDVSSRNGAWTASLLYLNTGKRRKLKSATSGRELENFLLTRGG